MGKVLTQGGSRIQLLPQHLVNKIAAGEVIERPASIVKELIENSIDAGASTIKIEVEDGGKKLIRITDNGIGIAPADAEFLFQSHATSKLHEADDLFRIATLGFRGEALSSIGAVAEVRVISCQKGNREGVEVIANCGEITEPRSAASPEGTTIEVRNLFYKLPARRKFLRSQDIEYSHVYEVVTRFAISCPQIRFDFVHNGKLELNLPKVDNLKLRIGHFFGKELMSALIEVTSSLPPYAFDALLAPPKFARVSLRSQYIFLNGRFIRDKVLTRAINEAFREMLPHGRYPVVFLFLKVTPDEVDVNVHPTKIEVRFRSVWKLHDLILNTLRKKLMETEIAPHITPNDLREEMKSGTYNAIVDFFSRDASQKSAKPSALYKDSPLTQFQRQEAKPLLHTGRRYFQLHNLYIVEEVEDGIVIIDQHALHERFMYEKLKKHYSSGDITKQRLLVPTVIELTKAERLILEDNRSLLESAGIEFDDFSQQGVAIRTVPAMLRDDNPAILLKDFIDAASEGSGSANKKAIPSTDNILHLIACRSAVMAGDTLGEEELKELLAVRDSLEYSQTCIHGRPTSIKLTLDDLEKFFKRRNS